ncbi:TPA: ead/Ea22-like family protein [Klebsiella pneumoniae]|nr:ead/Ea22-like family protein [Klebsiella pneumoniae]
MRSTKRFKTSWRPGMTDITELALITKIKKQLKNFDTVVLKEGEALALVEALEKAQQYAKERDAENQDLMLTVGRLRVEREELEPRSVKLPDDEDGQAYGFGKWANGKLPATAGTMTIAYCEDAWRAAFEVFSSAAGIKVEAE